MPNATISPNPLSALRATAGGAFAGTAVVSAVLWLVRMVREAAPPEQPAAAGPAFPLLVSGVGLAIAIAAGSAWWRMQSIATPFHRGALTIVAGFATIVGALAATPAYHFWGRAGLALFGATAAVAAAWLLQPSRRLGDTA